MKVNLLRVDVAKGILHTVINSIAVNIKNGVRWNTQGVNDVPDSNKKAVVDSFTSKGALVLPTQCYFT